MSDAASRPALLVLVRHGQSQRNIVKKQNRFYLDDESRRAVFAAWTRVLRSVRSSSV